MIEIADIKQLIELMKETDITEIMLEKDGTKLKLRREKLLTSVEMTRPGAASQEAAAAQSAVEETQRLVTVTSPLVGTFYRASSAEAPHFVEVGDKVKKGQVICIIEAMKLMNEIEAEVDGVVGRVLVENAQPVEYGEPLFLIEPL